MLRFALLSIPCTLLVGPSIAQHETDKWYFGNGGEGLDFTDRCEPAVLDDGNFSGFEGCATVADRNNGEVLFYTNSQSVIGRNHMQMPNGNLHVPGAGFENTITQVLITSRPGTVDQFYLFTNQVQGGFFGGGGMRMACVDMTLNSGFGDVVFKNSIIYADTVSEKVTAVRHANGSDIWVIGHGHPNDEFFAVHIGPQGPVSSPVLSHVGKRYGPYSMDCLGEMKADPIGDKIAVVTSGKPHIELFRFNRSTGVVSDPMLINSPEIGSSGSSWLYGVSFSPNGSKLYAGRKNFGNGAPSLMQVDVSNYDSLSIAGSYSVISTLDSVYSVHLAPNGKVYARRAGNFLGAINHPDNAGLACDFDPHAVVFAQQPGPMGTWGFNNNIALVDYPCLGYNGIVDDEQGPRSRISPIPSSGTITLHLKIIPKSAQVFIRDMVGRLVQLHRITDQDTDLTLPHSGVWFVELWGDGAPLAVHRVVAE